jgi:hypothetical protein
LVLDELLLLSFLNGAIASSSGHERDLAIGLDPVSAASRRQQAQKAAGLK